MQGEYLWMMDGWKEEWRPSLTNPYELLTYLSSQQPHELQRVCTKTVYRKHPLQCDDAIRARIHHPMSMLCETAASTPRSEHSTPPIQFPNPDTPLWTSSHEHKTRPPTPSIDNNRSKVRMRRPGDLGILVLGCEWQSRVHNIVGHQSSRSCLPLPTEQS